jgi:ribosomal protein S30
MTSHEKNTIKMEKRFKKWGAKLDALATKAAEARVENRENYQKRLSILRLKFEGAQKKLAEFKATGDGRWDIFKTDMETVWKDIAITYKGLKA